MGFYCITTANAGFSPLFVEDLKKARSEQAGKLGQHYCPAVFFEKQLSDAYVESLNCIWVDVDVPECYESFDEAVSSWSTTLAKMKFTEPSIWVSSGHGLHLYWCFGKQIQLRDWLTLRDGLVRAFMDNGLKADYAHTHPSAYMRTIGSVNEKTNTKVTPTKVGQSADFFEMLVKLSEYVNGGKKAGNLPAVRPFTGKTPKWDLIRERCDALRWASEPENQKEVPEMLWRALLSNVYVCEDGQKLIHDVSRHHPDYDPMKTDAKAQGTIPYTCQKIKECGGQCANCVHHVKSPISLGYAKEQATTNDSKDVISSRGKQAKQIGKFTVSEDGISCPTKDMDDMIQVCAIPIYLGDVIENTMGAAESGCYLEWDNANGEHRCEYIGYDILCSQPDCIKWLAKRNLMNKVFSLKEFVAYVLTGTSMKEKGQLRAGASRYGWQGDSLVMPYGKVTKNGIEKAYLIGDLPQNVRFPIGEPTGCIEMVFEKLLEKNNGLLVAPMLINVVAPLFPLMKTNPIVFYLSGMSGSGKSTVGYAAMCMFGFVDKYNMVEGSSTMNSIMDKMSSLNCLTLTLDEVSLDRRNDMREIIMQAVNGRPKGRLNKNAKQNTREEWYTPLIVTSNPSYSEGYDELDTAQGVRMAELSMVESLKISISEVLRMQNELVEDGANIALYIVQHKEELLESIRKSLEMITDDFRYDPSMRFLASTWATIKGGLKIIHDLYPNIFFKIVDKLPLIEQKVLWDKIPRGSISVIDSAVGNWIDENNDKIAVWSYGKCVNEDRLRTVEARYDQDNKVIYLKLKTVKAIMQKCAESTAALAQWAEMKCTNKGKTERKRLLGKSASVQCYGYRMDKDLFYDLIEGSSNEG